MTSSSPTYYEDSYTLQGMTEQFSEQLIREIQKQGLMVPEMVRFGSVEIEIYSRLDLNVCRHVAETLEEHDNFPSALASARLHVVEVYRVAHGEESIQTLDSDVLKRISAASQAKKLYVFGELLEALGMSEKQFHEILHLIQIRPMTLMVPGRTIEYYSEDDYLMLRYIVTLLGKGCPLEDATKEAHHWAMFQLW